MIDLKIRIEMDKKDLFPSLLKRMSINIVRKDSFEKKKKLFQIAKGKEK